MSICSDFVGKVLASDRFSSWFNRSSVLDLFHHATQGDNVVQRNHSGGIHAERFKSAPLPYYGQTKLL